MCWVKNFYWIANQTSQAVRYFYCLAYYFAMATKFHNLIAIQLMYG